MRDDKQYTKAYLVEFTNTEDNYSFLKFGATNSYDVEDRFKYDPDQYRGFDIRIISSIYAKKGNRYHKRMGDVEQYFLEKYPRNTKYFKENFSGISETYKPSDRTERSKIISEFYKVRDKVFNEEDFS